MSRSVRKRRYRELGAVRGIQERTWKTLCPDLIIGCLVCCSKATTQMAEEGRHFYFCQRHTQDVRKGFWYKGLIQV